jgi:hypothetical protein
MLIDVALLSRHVDPIPRMTLAAIQKQGNWMGYWEINGFS